MIDIDALELVTGGHDGASEPSGGIYFVADDASSASERLSGARFLNSPAGRYLLAQ